MRRDTKTLDSLVNGSVDLLKLDLQGAELHALRGATELLKRTCFVWSEMSFREIYSGQALFADVYHLLRAAGFMLVEIEPLYRLTTGELVEVDCLFATCNGQSYRQP